MSYSNFSPSDARECCRLAQTGELAEVVARELFLRRIAEDLAVLHKIMEAPETHNFCRLVAIELAFPGRLRAARKSVLSSRAEEFQ